MCWAWNTSFFLYRMNFIVQIISDSIMVDLLANLLYSISTFWSLQSHFELLYSFFFSVRFLFLDFLFQKLNKFVVICSWCKRNARVFNWIINVSFVSYLYVLRRFSPSFFEICLDQAFSRSSYGSLLFFIVLGKNIIYFSEPN